MQLNEIKHLIPILYHLLITKQVKVVPTNVTPAAMQSNHVITTMLCMGYGHGRKLAQVEKLLVPSLEIVRP